MKARFALFLLLATLSNLGYAAAPKFALQLDPAPFAAAYHVEPQPGAPYNSGEPPFMNGEPPHLRVRFDNDDLSGFVHSGMRHLLVYPVDEYRALYPEKERGIFDEWLATLKSLIKDRPAKVVKVIPILPAPDSDQIFRARVSHIPFKNGAGVGFVTYYWQDVNPILNDWLFYTFQGLTEDGKYWIAFYCPVRAEGLPATESPAEAAAFLEKPERKDVEEFEKTVRPMLESLRITAK